MNENPDLLPEDDTRPGGGKVQPSRPSISARLQQLRQSRLGRLAIALVLLGLTVLVLAFAVTRVLGPRQRFEAITLPYVEDFSAVDVKSWFSDAGAWSIREDVLAQAANLEKTANIFVPRELASDQPYHLSAYLTLAKNTQSAGVNFNAQYPQLTDKLHRVTINRNEDGSMELVAGYTDEAGNFVKQVGVPFSVDAQDYRIDIFVLGNTYTVQVNGQTLIERRPLFYSGGLAGFHSLGPARFDTLKITAAETESPGEQVYISDFDQPSGGAGWVPFSGEWEISQSELVQANPAAQDAGIGYEGNAFDNYALQASFRHLTGSGGGLLFNMASPYQLNDAHMVRYSDQTDSLFWGYFDAAGVFTRQGFQDIAAPGAESHQIRVYSGESSYDVFLDDQLIARGVPLQRSNGHIGLITSRSSVAYALVEAFPLFEGAPVVMVRPSQPTAAAEGAQPQPTPTAAPPATATPRATGPTVTPLAANSRVVVTGGAAPWTGAFTGDLRTAGWRPISGQWRFNNGALVQEDPAGFDYSIVYTGNAFRDHSFEASFSHRSGNGAGVLFNMPYADRLNGAYMVRYSDRRPGGVFWGYYDQSGKFVGQGYANVDPPGTGRHTLRVVSGDSSYSIFLNGALLADNFPLVNAQDYGYIGLITAQSSAVFDAVQVAGVSPSAAGAAATAIPAPVLLQPLTAAGTYGGATGFSDQRVVGGNWEISQGVYTQTVPDPADYVLNTGIYASNYSIQADITLPNKPDAGGGFMVHMPERARKSGATVVRFIRSGEGIFWGVYDESGAFRGRGSSELEKKPEGVYQLKLIVRGDSMDIFVDDQPIASDVRLPRSEGWIGLVAYGGPVTFANVATTVGLGQ